MLGATVVSPFDWAYHGVYEMRRKDIDANRLWMFFIFGSEVGVSWAPADDPDTPAGMAWRSHVNCLDPTISRADDKDDQQRWRGWIVVGMFDVPAKTADRRLYIRYE